MVVLHRLTRQDLVVSVKRTSGNPDPSGRPAPMSAGIHFIGLSTRNLSLPTYVIPLMRNFANENNRKLEVFGRKLEETTQNCIDILINISENETILFN